MAGHTRNSIARAYAHPDTGFSSCRYNLPSMPERYEPAQFEAKWRQRWAEADLFRTREEPGRPKFYGLDFFPYPSGAGLSVGHVRNYVITDVICRMKAMQGYNVLHPMGFDAFGLPAENEAIKRKVNPAKMIDEYAATYRRQMDLVGISYDWSRSFKSSDPTYYKWTQWIFEILYRRGLAYRKLAHVNWCPKDKTALANEEVVGGLCERCGTPVEKRAIEQWFFKITDYAQRLLDDLDTIDWPEGIKTMQRNWIGRSEGVEFSMKVVRGPLARPEETSAKTPEAAVPGDPELEALRAEVAAEATADQATLQTAQAIAAKLARSIGDVQQSFADAAAKVDAYTGELEIVRNERDPYLRVFTTRIDTLFGVTFCVVAPEHPIVDLLIGWADEDTAKAIRDYRDAASRLGDMERQVADRAKTGVFTGAYAINPANGKTVPIYVADYVLMGYGTGAIMAVPGHDERDYEFAIQHGIPVVRVIAPSLDEQDIPLPYPAKDGVMVNSGEYTGVPIEEGQRRLGEWMEALGIGERKVNYKIKDWLISRQRYWGCPIPVIHSRDGDMTLVPESDLPVYLPDVEHYEPGDDGASPLAGIPDFVNVTDADGRLGRRETDTMGGFACSSWYFLRFCDPHNEERAWDPDKVAYWMPVDCYVGGAEHAVMHLLYARFWMKVLYDEGLVPVQEPFQRLMNQGQVLGHTPYRKPREGERLGVGEEGILISYEEAAQLPPEEVTWRWVRMSKSKGNVVTPDETVEAYGADALRLYELFVAPFDADVEWSNEGMNGQVRFLSRAIRLCGELAAHYDADWRSRIGLAEMNAASREVRRATHKTIRKATEDIERFAFNTYVAALMTYVNTLNDALRTGEVDPLALSEGLETLVLLLSPAAPHTADEMWESIGREGFTYNVPWPVADEALAADDLVRIAVQVNGKLRDTLEVPADATNEDLERAALASEKVAAHTEGKTVRKVIVVPGRLVNIVAG